MENMNCTLKTSYNPRNNFDLAEFKLFMKNLIHDNNIDIVPKNAVLNCLNCGNIDNAIKIKNEFNISDEFIKDNIIQVVVALISKSSINTFTQIKGKFNISDNVIKSKEVQSAAKEKIINLLEFGFLNINHAIIEQIKSEFNISDEFMKSDEVILAAKKGIINYLKLNDIDNAIKIKNEFNISDEFMKSDEVISALKEGVIFCIKQGDFNKINQIINELNLKDSLNNYFVDADIMYNIIKDSVKISYT